MPKVVPAALNTHLQEEVTSLATCWAIRRKDSKLFFFTDHDQDLDLTGTGALPEGPLVWMNDLYISSSGFTRSAISSREQAINDSEIEAILTSDYVTEEDIEAGLFDNSEVYTFVINWQDPSDGVVKVPGAGTFGELKLSPKAGTYIAEIKGLTQCLQTSYGHLYAPKCRVDLFSYECRLNESSSVQHGTITSVTDDHTFTAAITPAAFGSTGLTIPNSDFASAGTPPSNWTPEVYASTSQWTVSAGELVGSGATPEGQREYSILSDEITIPGGVPTADIDNGLALISVSADIASASAVAKKKDRLEDAARLGAIFYDAAGDEIGRQESPLIREYQHGLASGSATFTRVLQVQKLARSVRIRLVGMKESQGVSATMDLQFDNIAATISVQSVLSIPGPFLSNYFRGGYIVMTSGALRSEAFEVSAFNDTTKVVTLLFPTPILMSATDQFTIYPGCLKRLNKDCDTKWSNHLNFRGEPYVPSQDDAFRTPDAR